jgi:hypothetical protein
MLSRKKNGKTSNTGIPQTIPEKGSTTIRGGR